MRVLPALSVMVLAAAAGGWWITAPDPLPASTFDGLAGDPARGETVFAAAGCASCHVAPGAAEGAELVLAGGQRFPSDFGTFVAPNISPSASGIGGWSVADLGNALMRGVSPEGAHYYPALPYGSYARMQPQDVADLHAYMQGLPPSDAASQPHEIGFPFSIRRTLGVWKALFLTDGWVMQGDLSPEETRGREIVEALAHCGECHTPRNVLGGVDMSRWLAGAPNPSGEGNIPNITPAKLRWSQGEIVTYLTSGFTPEYDSVGGHMAHVVENMASLPESDRRAVAAYLARVPAAE
ncbi:c-type cytochrome [Rhodobacteraceae bacterium HSP-20]|uniref:C-type cytochrome n=1 Tax=Paragemmobacter amnigenus TaxID=2852097 RepID=A0ABS6J3U5_9RHOB|nr:c-type cytochrome [Rhodobacter amnigenus]MBU9698435.1 c-type cytochrome [Rhodobacter amnigenus]MBV4389662.1 c-type cytochrome [Rhodobacter amnigenus]